MNDNAQMADITMRIAVPSWARFIASDGHGCVWAFEVEPVIGGAKWWDATGGREMMVAEANWWYVDQEGVSGDLYGEWRESLKRIADGGPNQPKSRDLFTATEAPE